MDPPPTSGAGYLWVLSEPGAKVTQEEYTDWYDNEHVPLRMGAIKEFLTGSRWEATDGKTPGFSANYDTEDVSLFSHDKYTRLRANRSPREGALVVRLETLDRRTAYKVDETSVAPLKAADCAKFMATVAGFGTTKGDGRELEGVKGWRRSHRHVIYDSLKTGVGHAPEPNVAPKIVSVHEFDDESYLSTPEWKAAIEGAEEVRSWGLYRAWDNTA